MEPFKVAGVQMDIYFAERERNLARMKARLEETVAAGAALTVFPECTTTGYCYRSLDEAVAQSESLSGASVRAIEAVCRRLDTRAVFGLLEWEGNVLYNTVVLVGPRGLEGSYRKIHLPFLGVDRFTTRGDRPFEVFETPLGRIGLNICYDSSFPEAARCLAVQGADLIALPTNWPPTSGLTAEVIPPARALENHVYFMAINRIGEERGFEFIGKSRICDPSGRVLDVADHAAEAILYAEVDPEFARRKHLVNIPGEHEVHRMEDRCPAAYGPLLES